MGELSAYLGAFATIAAAVWGGIHGMWKFTRMSDRQVAITVAVLGIVSGLLVQERDSQTYYDMEKDGNALD